MSTKAKYKIEEIEKFLGVGKFHQSYPEINLRAGQKVFVVPANVPFKIAIQNFDDCKPSTVVAIPVSKCSYRGVMVKNSDGTMEVHNCDNIYDYEDSKTKFESLPKNDIIGACGGDGRISAVTTVGDFRGNYNKTDEILENIDDEISSLLGNHPEINSGELHTIVKFATEFTSKTGISISLEDSYHMVMGIRKRECGVPGCKYQHKNSRDSYEASEFNSYGIMLRTIQSPY